MLLADGDGDDSPSQGSGSLSERLLAMILPVVEDEVQKRLIVERKSYQEEILQRDNALVELQLKYNALKEQMQRSREEFERKKKEWQDLKDMLSKKERLRNLLISLESPSVPPVQQLGPEDVKCSPGAESTENNDHSLGVDQLNILAELVEPVKSQKHDHDNQVGVESPEGKRPISSPKSSSEKRRKYIEPIRKKGDRKQLHANDCPCCSKVLFSNFSSN